MTRHVAIDPDELKRIVKEAVREELSAAGLRIDEPEHQFEAREDFRFLRNLRQALSGISSKIGAAVILADPIFQGLAISLLFGLASSTALTVLVIPAIYVALRGERQK